MNNKHEEYVKLATRIYELDAKVYKASGSGLGSTLSGSKNQNIENLVILIMSSPQGHLLRSQLALIGNMAKSTRNKQVRDNLLGEYNDILDEIASLP